MKLQEYGTSYHLVAVCSMAKSSESLTFVAVTLLHSHEVFTLHCSTSVRYSTTLMRAGSTNSASLDTVPTLPAESAVGSSNGLSLMCSTRKLQYNPHLNISYYTVHYKLCKLNHKNHERHLHTPESRGWEGEINALFDLQG